MPSTLPNPQKLLKTYFGFDNFRPLQAEIIETIATERRDVLVLMPTGGGKSVCYQIPALMHEGLCVVISPLIALMRDQVAALKLNGINAAFLNSTQTANEQHLIEEDCYSNKIQLLYVSPEKLQTEWFKTFLSRININLFAIDEAHCISFWGHDFRPEYKQLTYLKQAYPNIPIIALTATADKLTRQDILTQLKLNEPQVFISSFDRPNIFLAVKPAQDRVGEIVKFLKAHPNEAGIIYCLSRKGTEQLAQKLCDKNFKAAAYHAGLSHQERSKVQDDFLKDRTLIVCATVAFGMGIDKSNVRYVVHYNLPKNIESYYQEIGRAGRDGAPADALLFYTYSDVAMQREMLEEEESSIKEVKLAKLTRLQQFAESHLCRRRTLLAYFNENLDKNCGKCDVCRSPRQTFDATTEAQKILSAISRANQNEPTSVIVDILRGYRSNKIVSNNYDLLKTFGVGREHKPIEWSDYIAQLIGLGYVEIAYDRNNALTLSPQSKAVLLGTDRVNLVKAIPYEKTATPILPDPAALDLSGFNKPLFEHLREVRLQLAEEASLPAYLIFSDNTLRLMATYMPKTEADMLGIAGVGNRKMESYGHAFLQAIREFLQNDTQAPTSNNPQTQTTTPNNSPPKAPTIAQYRALLKQKLTQLRLQLANQLKCTPASLFVDKDLDELSAQMPVTPQEVLNIVGKKNTQSQQIATDISNEVKHFLTNEGVMMKTNSPKITYAFLQLGLNADQIAEKRFITANTVIGHVAELFQNGYDIDLQEFMEPDELADMMPVFKRLGVEQGIKPLYDAFDGKYNYGKVRLAMAYFNRDE
ncbi:MAG: DNA helicase RecQ [Sphingobacteriales bacterium]|nr:DNA helicase RecQ [Sphingobacteriales bacterium]